MVFVVMATSSSFQRMCIAAMVFFTCPDKMECALYKESFLFLTPLCDLEDRLARGCVRSEPGVLGLSKCSSMCNTDDMCVGVSTDEYDRCFLHRECPDLMWSCSVTSTNHKYMSKHCDNGGSWLPSENRCQCTNDRVGKTCQEYPETCWDLKHHGYNGFRDVMLKSDGNGDVLFLAKCHFDRPNNWVGSYVLWNTGRDSFNQTWAGYRDGFKTNGNSYWIGLESLYRQTKKRSYTLVLFFRFSLNPLRQTVRHYKSMKLSDENDGYRLTFESTSHYSDPPIGTFGDCLGDFQNVPFSTWDNDQDIERSRNCAFDVGSGWWFTDCNSKCNVFGYYPDVQDSNPYEQVMRVEGVGNETFHAFEKEFVGVFAYFYEP